MFQTIHTFIPQNVILIRFVHRQEFTLAARSRSNEEHDIWRTRERNLMRAFASRGLERLRAALWAVV